MNVFGFPVEITKDVPPNQIMIAPSDLIAALRMSAAAKTMAQHGVLPTAIASEIERSVDNAVLKAAQEKRVCVITNIGS